MLFKSNILAIGLAFAGLAAAVPATTTVSHVATYDKDFSTNILGIGPQLPPTYLDLATHGWGVVSRVQKVNVGGVNPDTPYNYILTNSVFAPDGAYFAAAYPYTKVLFKSLAFGFVVQDANGAVDVSASDTLTLQGYDQAGNKVPGASLSRGFQGAGVAVNAINQVKITFPANFPAVYKLTFSFTQPTLNALLVDTLSYGVSK